MSDKHIYSLDTLLSMAYDVKKAGKKIVLTHGAFDLFHVGHLHLLRESAKRGDFLVVGVDSDKSIMSYKKKVVERPIISQDMRMQIISELNCVDGVFLLDPSSLGGKDVFKNLYREFKVDVVTIGNHFYAEDKLRNDLKHQKRSKAVKITNNFDSTTSIIESILRKSQAK